MWIRALQLLLLSLWMVSGFSPTALASSPVYEEAFIVSPGEFPASHGSSIVEMDSGKLLSCWYSGTREGGRDVQIYCRDYNPVTRRWSSRRVAVKSNERPEGFPLQYKTLGNAALYYDPASRVVWMFYTANSFGGWSAARIDYKTSTDGGRSWSKPQLLVGWFGNLVRNKPIRIDANRIMLPAYEELFSKRGYGCLLTLSGKKILPGGSSCSLIPGEGHLQPTLVLREPGPNPWENPAKVWAYLRVEQPHGKTLFSEFDFQRGSWSEPEDVELPNPDAALDATTTPEGDILAVYDDSATVRTPLSLALSKDGRAFTKLFDFENDPSGDFSYPAIIRGADGTYHLTYTYKFRSAIKYVRFNEAWLFERLHGYPMPQPEPPQPQPGPEPLPGPGPISPGPECPVPEFPTFDMPMMLPAPCQMQARLAVDRQEPRPELDALADARMRSARAIKEAGRCLESRGRDCARSLNAPMRALREASWEARSEGDARSVLNASAEAALGVYALAVWDREGELDDEVIAPALELQGLLDRSEDASAAAVDVGDWSAAIGKLMAVLSAGKTRDPSMTEKAWNQLEQLSQAVSRYSEQAR